MRIKCYDQKPERSHQLDLEVSWNSDISKTMCGSTIFDSRCKVSLLFSQHIANISPSSPFPHSSYLSLLTSLVTTPHPPSHPALGSHCVFITIKESPACLAIRPHYSALRFLTLVTLWSVIWSALMQDFLAGGSPQVGWEVYRHTQHTDYILLDVFASRRYVRNQWLPLLMTCPPWLRPIGADQICSQFWAGGLGRGQHSEECELLCCTSDEEEGAQTNNSSRLFCSDCDSSDLLALFGFFTWNSLIWFK